MEEMELIYMWIAELLPLSATMFSFIFGAIGATILLVSKNKKMGQEIAFGPYIVMAVMLMMFFGESILGMYFNQL